MWGHLSEAEIEETLAECAGLQRSGKLVVGSLSLWVGRERSAYARTRAGALATAEKALSLAFSGAGRADVAITKCLRGGSLAVVDHGVDGHRGPLKVAMYCSVANRVDFNEEKLQQMGIDAAAIERGSRAAARGRRGL